MSKIERFHDMEIKYKLFSVTNNSNLPIWDVLRLHIFFKIYYEKEDLSRLLSNTKFTINRVALLVRELFISIYLFIFRSGENVFLTSSGAKNESGKFYDKAAYPLIKSFSSSFFIIESNSNSRFVYKSFNGFFKLFRPFIKIENLSIKDFNLIQSSINEFFPGTQIDYNELNKLFLDFQYDFRSYKFLFSFKKTKNVFISRGNEKGAFFAAKKLKITTFEIQHAAIEFDNPLYSYPQEVNATSNIAYPDIFLNFGSFWMEKNNIPSKSKYTLGLNFPTISKSLVSTDFILFISTIIHGDHLSFLAQELANKDLNLNIKFKLHPNEYKRLDFYKNTFKKHPNIEVILNEVNVNELVFNSKLVILIASTVLYEAVVLGKKVGIYQRLNYKSQRNALMLPNVFCFNSVNEIFDILDKPSVNNYENNIFEPLDNDLIKKIKTGKLLT